MRISDWSSDVCSSDLLGLPLVPFEALEDRFPPERYDLLIAIGPHQVNAPRAARFEEGRAKGYRFASYVASGARLWPDLEMGPGCMIFENAVVEPFSRRSEEHTSELTSLMRNSYAVFCL